MEEKRRNILDLFAPPQLKTWTDKITFLYIFVIWISTIVFFGLAYFLFSTAHSHLLYTSQHEPVTGLIDSIYFSFITATTTGFGDIIPTGYFKIIAILQVVSGYLLLALVTSRLVSIKQDVILGEIYEISFNERVNRLRSSLLLFRQNLSKLIDKIEGNIVRTREINELYMHIATFEDSLNGVHTLIRSVKGQYIKIIDPVSTELIMNSVIHSLEKLNELIITLNTHNVEWRKETNLNHINNCLSLAERIFYDIDSNNLLPKKSVIELGKQKDQVVTQINIGMEVVVEKE